MNQKASLPPSLAIACSAVLWGTLWIPLRALHEAGGGGAGATTAGLLLPLLVLLPPALARWRRVLDGGRPLGAFGLCLALSIALYAGGLLRGHVARVILLFYLTPVWSTLLARVLLGEPITRRRISTIVLGLAGMLVIFGVESGIPVPGVGGEWMGLAAGVAWAVAMVYANRTASRPLLDRLFVAFALLGPVFWLVTLFPGAASTIRGGALLEAAPWLLALSFLWMLPVLWLTVLGASLLDPGRVAILLMLEIVVGLTTAALLAGEPFGAREIIGAALIMGASGVEVAPQRSR